MTSTTQTESVMDLHFTTFHKNMNASNITIPYINSSQKAHLPATSRGSALYHVDWFLNGHPSFRNHDDARMSIKDLVNR